MHAYTHTHTRAHSRAQRQGETEQAPVDGVRFEVRICNSDGALRAG